MSDVRLVRVGTAASAGAISANVISLGSDVPVAVLLSQDYTLLHPPGYPTRPDFDGAAQSAITEIIKSGTTFKFLKCEADAIVTAGAGSYA